MQFVPEWAPNIHPIIIHFPIVLLIVAVLFDLAGLVFKKFSWLRNSAITLYIFGTIFALIAFFTGKDAADSLTLLPQVITHLTDHADWANITVWFWGIFTLVRILVHFGFKNAKLLFVLPLISIGLVGLYFVYQTADHGAKLVFGYGLGTGNLVQTEIIKDPSNHSENQISDSTFVKNDIGSWRLLASGGVVEALKDNFQWVKGSFQSANPTVHTGETFIEFNVNEPILFLSKNKMKNLQIEVSLNLDSFKGSVYLVHHFNNENNFDFMKIGERAIALGKVINEKEYIIEESELDIKNWVLIKNISDGDHFRGYIDNELLLHGHGDESDAGEVGLLFKGNGNIGLKVINVTIIN